MIVVCVASSPQRAGDIEQAAVFMNEARLLDTADRFVNCKCVKYYLRSNSIDLAIDTAGLFTRVSPGLRRAGLFCTWLCRKGGTTSTAQPAELPR